MQLGPVKYNASKSVAMRNTYQCIPIYFIYFLFKGFRSRLPSTRDPMHMSGVVLWHSWGKHCLLGFLVEVHGSPLSNGSCYRHMHSWSPEHIRIYGLTFCRVPPLDLVGYCPLPSCKANSSFYYVSFCPVLGSRFQRQSSTCWIIGLFLSWSLSLKTKCLFFWTNL